MIPTLKYSVSDVLCVEVVMNMWNDLYERVVKLFVITVGFQVSLGTCWAVYDLLGTV